MKIANNETFKQLLSIYDLPEDFSFSVDLPLEVHEILSDEILHTDYGITLRAFNRLYKGEEESQSVIEDRENHFHVDWYIEPPDAKQAFMLGIKTLTLLAEKFREEGEIEVRFWYSFQTPELGKLWVEHNNLTEEDDEHYISDRLSFYKRRKGEEVLPDINKEKYWAILVIDI